MPRRDLHLECTTKKTRSKTCSADDPRKVHGYNNSNGICLICSLESDTRKVASGGPSKVPLCSGVPFPRHYNYIEPFWRQSRMSIAHLPPRLKISSYLTTIFSGKGNKVSNREAQSRDCRPDGSKQVTVCGSSNRNSKHLMCG